MTDGLIVHNQNSKNSWKKNPHLSHPDPHRISQNIHQCLMEEHGTLEQLKLFSNKCPVYVKHWGFSKIINVCFLNELLAFRSHGPQQEGSLGPKSESFTAALRKFTSLSSSNITINLPAMSALPIPTETTKTGNTRVKTIEERKSVKEKKFSDISTQTVESEWSDSQYCYDGHLYVVPKYNSALDYYNTSYSRDCHLYSTLV